MSNSKPVYDFLWFKLLNVSFNRYNDGKLEEFSFRVSDQNFNEDNKVFSLCINTRLKFQDNDDSTLLFLTAFHINDLEWFYRLDDQMKDSMFFSIVFPFIRQKINELCDDSRESVKIPIVSLKNIRLDKEVVFELIEDN